MALKLYIGLASFVLSFLAIFLNLLIFIPVFRLGFIAKKSTIYVIAFFNILSDLMQLSITCFYLTASIVADRYVITGARTSSLSIIFGWIFINAWYMECLVQIVMAVNRFTVISLQKRHIFTFKTTLAIFVVLISTTAFSAICTQYVFPCCVFICDKDVMSFMFINIEGLYSYSNLMLVSYDVFCTSTSTLCYISVFRSIRKSYKTAPSNVQKKRANDDVKYLTQFVFISIFFIFTWVLFELLPYIVPKDQPEWFSVVPVLVTLNCSSNSIIYLSMNKHVQQSLQIPWLRNKLGGPKSSSNVNVIQV
ncbi:Protein CBR-SRX-5, partial [Caenorhabditis briggsae]